MQGVDTPWLAEQPPVLLALMATIFTWLMTAAGAVPVFFVYRQSQRLMDAALGAAAGVMLAASYWSLLSPALQISHNDWVQVTGGFLAGAAFIFLLDKILPHLHPGMKDAEGAHTSWRRSVLLVLAVTLHNLPEGLAVGVAFGAADFQAHGSAVDYLPAMGLALGIGLQNFPEGLAVALPLHREGLSRTRAFLYGQASGLVEIVAGVLGAWLVLALEAIVPFAMAFAAGAMVFVVVEELIPASQRGRHNDLASLGAMLGFALMMALDTALG